MAEDRLFQALSDRTRLVIVGILAEGPLNVTRIVDRVKAAQPAVSRHLRILREVGLIKDRRLGKEVEYSLEVARVREAVGWLGELAVVGASHVRGPEEVGAGERGERASGRSAMPASRGSATGEGERGASTGVRPAGSRAAGDVAEQVEASAESPGVGSKGGRSHRQAGKPSEPARGPDHAAGGKRRVGRISPLASRGPMTGDSGRMPGASDQDRRRAIDERRAADVGSKSTKKRRGSRVEPEGGGQRPESAAEPGWEKPKSKPRRPGSGKGMGAGIMSPGGRGRKGRAGKKQSARKTPKRTQKREPEPEAAYVVEREKDKMDDFLL